MEQVFGISVEALGIKQQGVHTKEIHKGWSEDKKCLIQTTDGQKQLLRLSDSSHYEKKKKEYEAVRQAAALGIPMSQPLDFGLCDDGKHVYTLYTWCEGEDAEQQLPFLTDTEQYVLGLEAGRILKKLHSIPAPGSLEPWNTRFIRKAEKKIALYEGCGIEIEGGDSMIAYLRREDIRELLDGRPQCFQHGDYHVGNMVLDHEKKLSVIDFNRYDYGDPWEEFNRIVWSAKVSPHFATGQLNGYFGGRPPEAFFQLLAFYMAGNTISSVPWAVQFGEEEVAVMKQQARDVTEWFDCMKNPVPAWYLEDFYIQYIDKVPCKLKPPYGRLDTLSGERSGYCFTFLKEYGEVFKVFDDQDSGNLCFGTEKDGKRYFIKFAGAPTLRYNGSIEDAVDRLVKAAATYRALQHPALIRLIEAKEMGGGFGAVFEWADGDCMGRQYPLSCRKFSQAAVEDRWRIFQTILEFHAFAAQKGYVAIDFYDGSIMYDFELRKTVICDIDFYQQGPCVNHMGRMWGSSRFMSPEEYEKGAVIDEVTNVYLMGAAAFFLFGGGSRERSAWQLTDELFEAAKTAVNGDRCKRQQSIARFREQWNMQPLFDEWQK